MYDIWRTQMSTHLLLSKAKLLWPWLFLPVFLAACTTRIVAPVIGAQPATTQPTTAPAPTVSAKAVLPPDSPVEFVWAQPAGTLSYPKFLALDKQGTIYVPDSGHDRMQTIDPNGKLLKTWGSTGSGKGQFIFICLGECKPACPPLPVGWPRCYHLPSGGVAIDEQGNVFVADFNSRIQKFDSKGNFLTQWGSRGTGDGQFLSSAQGLAVDKAGNVYAVDGDNHRIQKFDNQGKFLLAWTGKQESDEPAFDPFGVAVDQQGYVYVTDDKGVQKFDSDGNFLTKWGSLGSDKGQLTAAPDGVAVDSKGNVYVVDNGGDKVLKFDGKGNFLGQWGSHGVGDGQFASPTGIIIDKDDNIYIADRVGGHVQKFRQK